MQQKFKIGDKVKVLTNVYGCDIHGKIGTIIKLGGSTCIVERNMQNYDQEEWGRVEEDSWRYCFYESELELVTDQEVSNPKLNVQITVNIDENICAAFNEVKNGLEILLSGKSEPKCEFEVGDEVLLGGCLAEVASVKQHDTATLIGVKQGSYYFIVSPEDLQHYKKEESEKVAENTQKLYQDLKESFEQLFADEPSYTIGQEVYVSNDFNRYLRKGVLLDAIPRNGLMHVNIGGFDCFVEEERVYTREEAKGD